MRCPANSSQVVLDFQRSIERTWQCQVPSTDHSKASRVVPQYLPGIPQVYQNPWFL
jgi:hypothetical protein